MTTRTELLNAFKTDLDAEGSFLLPPVAQPNRPVSADGRSRIEETLASVDGTRALEWHICFYWDQPAWNKKNQHFWVVDPGTASEAADWMGNDPKPPEPEPTFQQAVLTWLRNKVGQTVGPWTIKHIENASADQEAQTATARALCEDATGNAWLDVFLSRDAQGDVQIEVLEITRLGG